MFNDTIAKIREEVAELEQFDYTSDDLILASNITGRIRKWLKELEEDLEAANEKAQKERNELCDEYHKQLKLHHNELRAIKEELAQKEKKIEKLYHDLDDSDREIYNLRDDNIALVERIKELESENEGMAWTSLDNISDLKMKIKERDEWIENLKEENGSLKRLLDDYHKKLEDNDYENRCIGRRLGEKNERLLKLERELKAANQEIEKLNKELAIARIGSQTRMGIAYIDSNIRAKSIDEAFKAIDEAIKKLDEEI